MYCNNSGSETDDFLTTQAADCPVNERVESEQSKQDGGKTGEPATGAGCDQGLCLTTEWKPAKRQA